VHKLWKLEGTAVPIISPAHGTEHGAGKCKFNEEGGGNRTKKPYSLRATGATPTQSHKIPK